MKNAKFYLLFQFHKGTIKALFTQVGVSSPTGNFNSIKVQLKPKGL